MLELVENMPLSEHTINIREAPPMSGQGIGFVSLSQLKMHNINVIINCIVHQESLCSKRIGLTDTMKLMTNIINKIRVITH